MSRVGDDQLQPFDESVFIVHGCFYCKINEPNAYKVFKLIKILENYDILLRQYIKLYI